MQFATCDKNMLAVKSTQAQDMTIQMYCNMKSTYSSGIIIFVLAIASLNKQI